MNVGNYSEALERQVAISRRCLDQRFVDGWCDEFDQAALTREMATIRWRSVAQDLLNAETVYVDSQIASLLAELVTQPVPSCTLDENMPFVPSGFVWFATNPGYVDATDAYAEMRAISWASKWATHVLSDGKKQTSISHTRESQQSFRILETQPWYTTRLNAATLPFPASSPIVLPFGAPIATTAGAIHALPGVPQSTLSRNDAAFCGRLLIALWRFLDQKILVAPKQQAERHARKRLEREGWQHEPLIRVVQLRRHEHAGQADTVQPTEREWSCQWVVRGHWRQQWYAKAQRNQPIWITPYVKGPEDKPLKTPRATVFAVVR